MTPGLRVGGTYHLADTGSPTLPWGGGGWGTLPRGIWFTRCGQVLIWHDVDMRKSGLGIRSYTMSPSREKVEGWGYAACPGCW